MKLFLFIAVVITSYAQKQEKLKAEDIVARHLKVIGGESLSKINNQVVSGEVKFTILRSGGAGADGKAVLASENRKLLLGMSFPVANYPREVIIFDGKDSKVSYAYNNARSPFGNYIYRFSDVLEEGLLGGVLSTGWALKRLDETKAKIKLEGTRKIDNREAYVLSYTPKRGSDLEIFIFIDRENFQHLRTEYRRIISASQAISPDASSSIRERREILIEDFSNHKRLEGLSFPYRYKIYLMLEGQNQGLSEYEWIFEVVSILFNQQLDPNSFSTKEE
ncbi:MAG: hypothetical protein D6687_05315 [Acidobacteria bacterium]|nr:MAG: hypothetical protein D6687_05315 [Acidobacteriota bacterium]